MPSVPPPRNVGNGRRSSSPSFSCCFYFSFHPDAPKLYASFVYELSQVHANFIVATDGRRNGREFSKKSNPNGRRTQESAHERTEREPKSEEKKKIIKMIAKFFDRVNQPWRKQDRQLLGSLNVVLLINNLLRTQDRRDEEHPTKKVSLVNCNHRAQQKNLSQCKIAP